MKENLSKHNTHFIEHVDSNDIKIGTKISFAHRYEQCEGIVTELLPYNKEIGLPHYYVDTYPGHPISVVDVLQILE